MLYALLNQYKNRSVNLYVLPVRVWVFSGYSGFLPQSKAMLIR